MAYEYSNCRQTVAFTDLFTFTRSSVKNVYDRSGNLVEVPANEPAFSYDPVTGAPLGIDIEPSATNLLTYSEQFDDASWSKLSFGTASAPVVTANAGVAPDGTTTADRIVFDVGAGTTINDASIVSKTVSGISLTPHTQSIFMKSNTSETYEIILYDGNAGVTGTKTITPDRYTRIDLTRTPTVSNYIFRFGIAGDTALAQVADVLVWGSQLEAGSVATSYTKTEATTVVRAADQLSIDNIDTSAWLNQSEFEFKIKWNDKDTTTQGRYLTLVDSATNGGVAGQLVSVGVFSGVYGFIYRRSSDGGGITITVPAASKTAGEHTAILKLSNGVLSLSVDGSAFVESTDAPRLNDLGILYLGMGATTQQANATIKDVLFKPKAGA